LQQALSASTRNGHIGALLFIDLDNFKVLNDTRGHDKGDLLLQQVAQRLTLCIRAGDCVARLGGDEFVLVLEDIGANHAEATAYARAVAEKILTLLNSAYDLAGQECHNSPSIGITLFPSHQSDMDELMKQADLAMYESKKAGRNTLRFFNPQMQANITARAGLEKDLRQSVQLNHFVLFYQPQVDAAARITGTEALLRWQHPQLGLISPAVFIPLAEDTGLILPLGRWVLETACKQLALWAKNIATEHLSIAVNVSALQFRQADFVEQVASVVERSGANPYRLKLELTETLLLDHVEDIIAKITALKARGIGFALDDFGTGYSSLSYLKRLPLDQLKIDQSFVRDLLIDPNDAAIARTIVALANSLGLSVIAEGVETEEQRVCLAAQGCHAYQGYLFGKPVPVAEFELLLTSV
jgi:diguanylate cyclase (GGDEF)-like protein